MKAIKFIIAFSVLGSISALGKSTHDEKPVHITQLPQDKRSYRGLKLVNEMEILLISDPSIQKSTVSLTVGAGYLNNFRSAQGLSDIVGCLQLMGGGPYAEKFFFETYVKANGGQMKIPATEADQQIFTFDIKSTELLEALERFAELFRKPMFLLHNSQNPLMTSSLAVIIITLEKQLLQSSETDNFRIKEAEKALCSRTRKEHVYCNNVYLKEDGTLFSYTKNLAGLVWQTSSNSELISILDKAKAYHRTWYSAHLMTLVVIGAEDLNVLERTVKPLFEGVTSIDRSKMIYKFPEQHPWLGEELGHMIYVVPRENKMQILRINFPVPDVLEHYKTAPHIYLDHFISHKGPGTLHSTLEQKNFCSEIISGYTSQNGIAFFNISCVLFDEGAEKIDHIVNLIFQYIHLIRAANDHEERFTDLKNLLYIKYLEHKPNDNYDTNPASYAQNLAMSMQVYPLEDILTYKYFVNEWDWLLIQKFLECLTPFNMNISVISKVVSRKMMSEVRKGGSKKVYWFEKIPIETLRKWNNTELIPGLQLPVRNEFISQNFEMYPALENALPYLLFRSPKTEVWFKQDDKLRTPKIFLHFSLFSPSSISYSPKESILWGIFGIFLDYALAKYLDSAEEAQYSWETETEPQELRITLYGYSDKLPVLLERVLWNIMNLKNEITKRNFRNVLKIRIDSFKREKNGYDHKSQLKSYTNHLQLGGWSPEDTYNSAITLRYSDMEKFLSRAFRRIFIRTLIYGNSDEENALKIVDILMRPFQANQGLLFQEILPPRTIKISEGFHYIYNTLNNDDTYAFNFIFQLTSNPLDSRQNALTSLLHYSIENECRKLLKAYELLLPHRVENVQCLLLNTYNTKTIAIVMQSGQKYATIFSKFLGLFIHGISNKLRIMTNNDLDVIRKRVEKENMQKSPDQRILKLTMQYLKDITYRNYKFDRIEKEDREFRNINIHALRSFFTNIMFTEELTVRTCKLTICTLPVSTKNNEKNTIQVPKDVKRITDLTDFRNSSTLLPSIFYADSSNVSEKDSDKENF